LVGIGPCSGLIGVTERCLRSPQCRTRIEGVSRRSKMCSYLCFRRSQWSRGWARGLECLGAVLVLWSGRAAPDAAVVVWARSRSRATMILNRTDKTVRTLCKSGNSFTKTLDVPDLSASCPALKLCNLCKSDFTLHPKVQQSSRFSESFREATQTRGSMMVIRLRQPRVTSNHPPQGVPRASSGGTEVGDSQCRTRRVLEPTSPSVLGRPAPRAPSHTLPARVCIP
jgi:hypothetical protein